jgi:hypothetical protein
MSLSIESDIGSQANSRAREIDSYGGVRTRLLDPGGSRVGRVRSSVRTRHSNASRQVELATNEPPIEYPYFVHVERRGERWYAMQDHN